MTDSDKEGVQTVNIYPKIQSIFKRDPDNHYKTFLTGEYSTPEIEYLRDNTWHMTEKIDGTNIRVHWDGQDTVAIRGRTDKAELPPFLKEKLGDLFPRDSKFQMWNYPMTLYGEGYGARIQKGGGGYKSDGVDFVLFDVEVGGYWLRHADIQDVAAALDVKVVPTLGYGTLAFATALAEEGFQSQMPGAERLAEGIVLKTMNGLLDRGGQRIITKVKHRDFAQATE